jgi:hypothetical protein
MQTENQNLVAHPQGEQPAVEVHSAIADTFAGRVHVEWDATAPVTPFGQLPFFIDYLKQAGLFDAWWRTARCRSPAPTPKKARAARHRDAVGVGRPSPLRAHHRPTLRPGQSAFAWLAFAVHRHTNINQLLYNEIFYVDSCHRHTIGLR